MKISTQKNAKRLDTQLAEIAKVSEFLITVYTIQYMQSSSMSKSNNEQSPLTYSNFKHLERTNPRTVKSTAPISPKITAHAHSMLSQALISQNFTKLDKFLIMIQWNPNNIHQNRNLLSKHPVANKNTSDIILKYKL